MLLREVSGPQCSLGPVGRAMRPWGGWAGGPAPCQALGRPSSTTRCHRCPHLSPSSDWALSEDGFRSESSLCPSLHRAIGATGGAGGQSSGEGRPLDVCEVVSLRHGTPGLRKALHQGPRWGGGVPAVWAQIRRTLEEGSRPEGTCSRGPGGEGAAPSPGQSRTQEPPPAPTWGPAGCASASPRSLQKG